MEVPFPHFMRLTAGGALLSLTHSLVLYYSLQLDWIYWCGYVARIWPWWFRYPNRYIFIPSLLFTLSTSTLFTFACSAQLSIFGINFRKWPDRPCHSTKHHCVVTIPFRIVNYWIAGITMPLTIYEYSIYDAGLCQNTGYRAKIFNWYSFSAGNRKHFSCTHRIDVESINRTVSKCPQTNRIIELNVWARRIVWISLDKTNRLKRSLTINAWRKRNERNTFTYLEISPNTTAHVKC